MLCDVFFLLQAVITLITVGYGDIKPTTTLEVVYCLFVFVIAVTLCAVVIGNFTVFISTLDTAHADHLAKLDLLKRFMLHRKLPQELQQRVTCWLVAHCG